MPDLRRCFIRASTTPPRSRPASPRHTRRASEPRAILWLTAAFWGSKVVIFTLANWLEDHPRLYEIAGARVLLAGSGYLLSLVILAILRRLACRPLRLRPGPRRRGRQVGDFGEVTLASGRTDVGFTRKGRKFALVHPPAGHIDVGLQCPGVPPVRRFASADGWNTMVTHRVRILTPDDDDELVEWLRDAHDAAGGRVSGLIRSSFDWSPAPRPPGWSCMARRRV